MSRSGRDGLGIMVKVAGQQGIVVGLVEDGARC
jgi:hypothetical protein